MILKHLLFRLKKARMGFLVINIMYSTCYTTRTVLLTSQAECPVPKRNILTSSLSVNAPKKGENVCNFDDIAQIILPGQWRIGYSDGTFQDVYGLRIDGIKRATFKYYLEDDSAPLFENTLKRLVLKMDSTATIKSEARAEFRYFLTDRGAYKNELGILMILTLSLKDSNGTVIERTYTNSEAETYTSGWVTFPRSGTLNSLFNKSLSKIILQIFEDTDLWSSIRSIQTQ